MKCLLVSTLIDDVRSLGLLYIYQFIKSSNRHDAKLLFLTKKNYSPRDIEGLINFIKDEGIEVITFSLMTGHYRKALKLTKEIKSQLRDIKIIWGGIHPTLAPEECIEYVDYVCIGEGEVPILELLDRMESRRDTERIDNFWVNSGGRIIKNNPRSVADISTFPFPKFDWKNFYIFDSEGLKLFDRSSYRRNMNWKGTNYSVIATRGCPYSCTYCCNSILKEKMYGRSIRRRAIGDVISELEFAKEDIPFTNVVNFQDDCFLAIGKEWLKEFCEAYKERIGLPIFIRTIPAYVTEEKIALLKDAGLSGVSMGLQTGDDYINREIYNRPTNSREFVRAVDILNRNNIWGVYDVILQGPYDTDESYYKTAKILTELPRPFSIHIFHMVLFPKTALYERCKRENIDVPGDPYGGAYGESKERFYSKFIRIIPFMPKPLLRSFLEKRKSKIVNVILTLSYHFFSRLRRIVRGFLSRNTYKDSVIKRLFTIQAKVFNR